VTIEVKEYIIPRMARAEEKRRQGTRATLLESTQHCVGNINR
jgi:hypothetical protein